MKRSFQFNGKQYAVNRFSYVFNSKGNCIGHRDYLKDSALAEASEAARQDLIKELDSLVF